MRALDSDLLSRCDGAAEHAAERVETAIFAGGHHPGHVHHQGTIRVARSNRVSCSVVHETHVQNSRRDTSAKLYDDHNQQSVGRTGPNLHGSFRGGLACKLFRVTLEHDVEGLHHLGRNKAVK